MKTKGDAMGRFSVDFEVTNFYDMVRAEEGLIKAAEVRRRVISGVVDPGATHLVLPESLIKELGLPDFKSKVKVRYADGRRGIRREVGGVHINLLGRPLTTTAIAEPKRTTALIGAVILEILDFLVDPKNMKLVPRDPDYVTSEIE